MSNTLLRRAHKGSNWILNPFDDDAESLGSHFYYFHLGHIDDPSANKAYTEENRLLLPTGHYLTFQSLEDFNLPWNIMGLFGAPTELGRRGIQLLHGPTVDPGYRGKLELALVNHGPAEELTKPTAIGKILFIDISDTALEEDSSRSPHTLEREQRTRPDR